MSSPYARRPGSGIALTSPASSRNGALQSSSNRTGNGGGSLPSQQPILDPLALDATTRERLAGRNGAADEAEDEDMVPRRRRARNGEVTEYDDVPRVRDVTAEKVMESFAMFLEK
jgi:DNA replication licensing factor MCM6